MKKRIKNLIDKEASCFSIGLVSFVRRTAMEREVPTLKEKVGRILIFLGMAFIFYSVLILAAWFFSPPGAMFSGKILTLIFVGMVLIGAGLIKTACRIK